MELIFVNLEKHENWKYLLSEMEVAAEVLGNKTQSPSDDCQLSKDYDEALSLFEHVLRTQSKAQQRHLQTLLLA